MKRIQIKTTVQQIVEWGQSNIDECGYGVDATEMATHCWRCGHSDRAVERCHVIPDALGGLDTPSNYRLLCNDCHNENPNVKDPNEMDNWIRRTSTSNYNTFWTIREIGNEVINNASIHWGHGGELNAATKKWTVEEITKRLKKKFIFVDDTMLNPFKT